MRFLVFGGQNGQFRTHFDALGFGNDFAFNFRTDRSELCVLANFSEFLRLKGAHDAKFTTELCLLFSFRGNRSSRRCGSGRSSGSRSDRGGSGCGRRNLNSRCSGSWFRSGFRGSGRSSFSGGCRCGRSRSSGVRISFDFRQAFCAICFDRRTNSFTFFCFRFDHIFGQFVHRLDLLDAFLSIFQFIHFGRIGLHVFSNVDLSTSTRLGFLFGFFPNIGTTTALNRFHGCGFQITIHVNLALTSLSCHCCHRFHLPYFGHTLFYSLSRTFHFGTTVRTKNLIHFLANRDREFRSAMLAFMFLRRLVHLREKGLAFLRTQFSLKLAWTSVVDREHLGTFDSDLISTGRVLELSIRSTKIRRRSDVSISAVSGRV